MDFLSDLINKAMYKKVVDNVLNQGGLYELINGKIIGWRKKKVTKYLKVPKLVIEKNYDDEGEELDGYIIRVEKIETSIPIGKEIIKVPIREKIKKPITINFSRKEWDK